MRWPWQRRREDDDRLTALDEAFQRVESVLAERQEVIAEHREQLDEVRRRRLNGDG
ncbi:MAG TPA: hypothetical protein VGB14_09725 [Acidimicrobiales bacterium]|jgi:hypothetical protein